MPKMKTSKTAAKRFKRTASGKLVHRSVGLNHLLSKKGQGRKRRLRQGGALRGRESTAVKTLVHKP
jgi:large subunit ribosomal protein L35